MDRVVISRLAGGLGNQMFQYAIARALADHFNTPLFVDTSFLDTRNSSVNYTIRHFELDVFNVQCEVANSELLDGVRSSRLSGILQRIGLIKKNVTVLNETDYQEIRKIWLQQPPFYLVGYWQNENYFNAIRSILLREFVPKEQMSEVNKKISDNIAATNSASVHVRRGDYVTNNHANQFHGVCSPDYYNRAITKLVDEKNVNHFFVFSDDIVWSKENIVFPTSVTFIDHNLANQSYWDMILMSRCNHHIIANSSFSWWGAWLNPNQHKFVIAPKQWFAAGGGEKIVPSGWIKL